VYNIHPVGGTPTTAWCDMTNGGWTVIQRRMDGSEDFERLWADYAAGFGSGSGEYWLGLENIHFLTLASSSLVIELEAFPGTIPLTSMETYSNFSIGNASTSYTLSVDGYVPSGFECTAHWTSGDLVFWLNGMPFSTEDQEASYDYGTGCVWNTRSAWWHKAQCSSLSLNGVYHQNGYTPERGYFFEGVTWFTCWDFTVSLMKSVMRVKRN